MAAWGKLRHRAEFRTGLAVYHLLPIGAVAPVAAGLPLVELLLGVGLITGVGLPVASYGSAALLLAFSAAVIINLRRGREIACACTGVADEQPISWGLVVRNGLLILVAVWLGWHSTAMLTWTGWRAEWQQTRVLMTDIPSLLVLELTSASLAMLVRLIHDSIAVSTTFGRGMRKRGLQ